MDNNKLQHWGIKGQKHGLRRWQNKDGSLTPAGRRRYAKLAEKRDKLNAKLGEHESSGNQTPKLGEDDSPSATSPKIHDDYVKAHTRRDVSTMSTKEINDQLNRMDAERRYREATMTKGDKFKKWLKDTAVSVGKEVGKEYAKKAVEAGIDIGLSKVYTSTNREGVRTFLEKMQIKFTDKANEHKEYLKNARAELKAEAEESAKKMAAGLGDKTADSNSNAGGSNKRDTRDTRDKRDPNEKTENAHPKAAKQQSKAEDKAAKQQAKEEADAAKQWAKANRDDTTTAKTHTKTTGGEGKKVYEADEIRDRVRNASDDGFNNFRKQSGSNKTIYSDDFEDKTSTSKKTSDKQATATSNKTNDSSDTTITFSPREPGSKAVTVSTAKAATIKSMASSGDLSVSEIAKKVGVAPSTVSYYLNPKKKDDKK